MTTVVQSTTELTDEREIISFLAKNIEKNGENRPEFPTADVKGRLSNFRAKNERILHSLIGQVKKKFFPLDQSMRLFFLCFGPCVVWHTHTLRAVGMSLPY